MANIQDVLDDVQGLRADAAKAVREQFGSVADLASASVEDLTAIKGIGQVMAERIIESALAVRTASDVTTAAKASADAATSAAQQAAERSRRVAARVSGQAARDADRNKGLVGRVVDIATGTVKLVVDVAGEPARRIVDKVSRRR